MFVCLRCPGLTSRDPFLTSHVLSTHPFFVAIPLAACTFRVQRNRNFQSSCLCLCSTLAANFMCVLFLRDEVLFRGVAPHLSVCILLTLFPSESQKLYIRSGDGVQQFYLGLPFKYFCSMTGKPRRFIFKAFFIVSCVTACRVHASCHYDAVRSWVIVDQVLFLLSIFHS